MVHNLHYHPNTGT